MKPDKVTVPEVRPLVRHVYEKSVTGCCLHVVLDDDNLGDDSVEHCLRTAIERGHGDCETLAHLLLRMTRSQRGRLARMAR